MAAITRVRWIRCYPATRRAAVGLAPGDGDMLRKNDYASLRVGELARLVRQPVIAECAARLSGTPEIRLWHDQLLYKLAAVTRGATWAGTPTGTTGAPAPARRCCPPGRRSTTLRRRRAGHVRGGSDRWSDQIDPSFWDQDLTAIVRYAAEHGARIVTATLRRGQVSFHHCGDCTAAAPTTIPSPAARSPSTFSPETTLRPCRQSRRYRRRHNNDRLIRSHADGTPDYAEPAVRPRLWPVR